MGDTANVKSGFFRVRGGNIRYELAGDGPTLVLIHTGLADSRMFDPQFHVLARSCQVLRYDLHGFGRSSWPDEPYTHHEALHDLLDHLGIQHAALLGASLGGAVALDFVLTYPDMVDALIAVAAGIGGYPQTPQDQELFAPVVEAFTASDYTQAIDQMIHIWVDGPNRGIDVVDPAIRDRVRSLYTDVLLRTREGGRQPDHLDPPAYGRLHEIHVPALVIIGSGDISSIQDQADLLADSIPGAQKVVLPEVAHLLNLEVPEEFNRVVLAFLREHQLAR